MVRHSGVFCEKCGSRGLESVLKVGETRPGCAANLPKGWEPWRDHAASFPKGWEPWRSHAASFPKGWEPLPQPCGEPSQGLGALAATPRRTFPRVGKPCRSRAEGFPRCGTACRAPGSRFLYPQDAKYDLRPILSEAEVRQKREVINTFPTQKQAYFSQIGTKKHI